MVGTATTRLLGFLFVVIAVLLQKSEGAGVPQIPAGMAKGPFLKGIAGPASTTPKQADLKNIITAAQSAAAVTTEAAKTTTVEKKQNKTNEANSTISSKSFIARSVNTTTNVAPSLAQFFPNIGKSGQTGNLMTPTFASAGTSGTSGNTASNGTTENASITKVTENTGGNKSNALTSFFSNYTATTDDYKSKLQGFIGNATSFVDAVKLANAKYAATIADMSAKMNSFLQTMLQTNYTDIEQAISTFASSVSNTTLDSKAKNADAANKIMATMGRITNTHANQLLNLTSTLTKTADSLNSIGDSGYSKVGNDLNAVHAKLLKF